MKLTFVHRCQQFVGIATCLVNELSQENIGDDDVPLSQNVNAIRAPLLFLDGQHPHVEEYAFRKHHVTAPITQTMWTIPH